jgi:hypothetical protein
MSDVIVYQSPAAGAANGHRPGQRSPGGVALGQDVGRDARRTAAAILEVLAGVRTPAEAATALGLALPRYYQMETQALRGLVAACAPRPKGRQRSVASEVAALKRETERLRREAARHQALARAAQRAVGLAPPAPVKAAGKKTRRRGVARALRVATVLRQEKEAEAPPIAEQEAAP